MPAAHACFQCGAALTRVPARREPIYGFMLVCCPECGSATVRRRHPVEQGWRRLRGAVRSATMLVLQVGFLMAALALAWMAASAWHELDPAMLLSRLEVDPDVVAWVAGGTLAGVWIGAGLAHRRWWQGLAAFMLLLCAIVATVHLVFALDGPGLNWAEMRGEWLTTLSLTPLLLAGMALGRAFHAAYVNGRARRWRRKLERRRRRR